MIKNLLVLDENFEIESRKIEFGLKETLNFNDLTEFEKQEILENTMELEINFKIKNIFEIQ